MEVLVLHVADCPNVAVARARILAAGEVVGREVSVAERLVGSEGEAIDLGFVGSPTIWVRGHDPFAVEGTPPSLACRLYLGRDGYEGAPTVEALIEVLRRETAPDPGNDANTTRSRSSFRPAELSASMTKRRPMPPGDCGAPMD